MGDLISRKALIEAINEWCPTGIGGVPINDNQVIGIQALHDAIRIIDEQPTAYDLDGVLLAIDEALEIEMCGDVNERRRNTFMDSQIYIRALKEARRIIRKGITVYSDSIKEAVEAGRKDGSYEAD